MKELDQQELQDIIGGCIGMGYSLSDIILAIARTSNARANAGMIGVNGGSSQLTEDQLVDIKSLANSCVRLSSKPEVQMIDGLLLKHMKTGGE